MKKYITLGLIAASLSCTAFVTIPNPPAGMERQIPYTTAWSQRWLTNFSDTGAFGSGVALRGLDALLLSDSVSTNNYLLIAQSDDGTNWTTKKLLVSTFLGQRSVASELQSAGYGGYVSVSTTNGLLYVRGGDSSHGWFVGGDSSGLISYAGGLGWTNSYQLCDPFGVYPLSYNIPSKSNQVTQISGSAGISVAKQQLTNGIIYTIYATGTNQVSVTNLDYLTLAGFGALTVSNWFNYAAPISDYTNAMAYTNGLLAASVAAGLYQPIGSYQPTGTYLTPSSYLDYGKVTNAPVFGAYTNCVANAYTTQSVAMVDAMVDQRIVNLLTNAINTNSFASAEQSVYQNSHTYAIPHGLGVTPSQVRWVMVCKTADRGYSPGAEIDIADIQNSGNQASIGMWGADATNIFLVLKTSGNFNICNYASGAMASLSDATYWRIKGYAKP